MRNAGGKPDHYHAVAGTQWRANSAPHFAAGGTSIKPSMRAYEVTHQPVAQANQPMPAIIAAQYEELVELANLASHAAVARLELLVERHPKVSVLNNLLAAAYSRQGRMKDALAVVERNYRQSPEYLFARIQYAQLCLLAGKVESVPAIFDYHFDLKLLYPNRTKYHISEFVAFAAVAGEFFLLKGDRESAESYCRTLIHVAPDHEMTARLKSLMGDGE